jgi:MFS transporter, DHA3 family, macrolide efflux protein
MSQAKSPSARDVLRIADFRRLFVGQTISDFGDAMTSLALLLVVYKLTNSTAALALMAICLALPQVTVGIIAGVYVDRWDRRRVMLVSDLLRAAIVLGFVFVQSADMLWLLYALALTQAAVGTFFTPARTALIPSIVNSDGLLPANSLSQAGRLIAGVLGTGAAGVIVGLFAVTWPVFVVDSLTFLVSFLFVLRISAKAEVARKASAATTSVLRGVVEGMQVVGRSRLLTGALISAGVIMLGLGAINVLFVPLLINELQVPATWFGAIDLAQTSSMILSAIVLAGVLGRFGVTRVITWGMAGVAVIIGLLAGVTAVWQVLVLLFIIGWLVTPLQAALTTIIQTEAAEQVRGRVAALVSTVTTTASVVSMAIAGIFGDLIGVRGVFLAGAVVVALAALSAFVLFRGQHTAGDRAMTAAPVADGPLAA